MLSILFKHLGHREMVKLKDSRSSLIQVTCCFYGMVLGLQTGLAFFHRVYQLLLQKHLRQATCLGKGFILLICSLEVQNYCYASSAAKDGVLLLCEVWIRWEALQSTI